MSDHVEWAEATYVTRNSELAPYPDDVTDAYGTTNDRPAIVLDNGSSSYVVEGSRDELIIFGERMLDLAKELPEEDE